MGIRVVICGQNTRLKREKDKRGDNLCTEQTAYKNKSAQDGQHRNGQDAP